MSSLKSSVATALMLCSGHDLEAAAKSRLEGKTDPQRLKPFLLLVTYVRAEARTLQRNEFVRSLFNRAVKDEKKSGP